MNSSMNLARTRITIIFHLPELDFLFTEMYPNNSTVVRFPQEFQFPGFYRMQVSILTRHHTNIRLGDLHRYVNNQVWYVMVHSSKDCEQYTGAEADRRSVGTR